jgi:hypothetical protein
VFAKPDKLAELTRRRERVQTALDAAEAKWMAAAEDYEAVKVAAEI